MSVWLATDVAAFSRTPAEFIADHPGYSLASIPAGQAPGCGQAVHCDSLPEEPSHVVVLGDKTPRVRKSLAKQARGGAAIQVSLRH